eukprot:TRINITY_DN9929_c0_g1_i2.p2 TRINITY_DN9929_c0_g1~~TRINITY_DN9929_c0_g1_i2.p2  ORF type:complete len:257 (-),score=30.92 TRINITY_DN9929_c0_g1_i2:82-852(-)
MPDANVVLCGCGKCGTTTLYEYVFEQKFGHKWNFTGPPWLQNVFSPRWQGQFSYVRDAQAQKDIMESAFSFALVRDPRERLVSAWKSKLSCDEAKFGVDAPDRSRLVPHLLTLANLPPSETACLSLNEFLGALKEIRRLGRSRFLDNHFLPQDMGCFYRFPPEKWSKVSTIGEAAALADLSKSVGGPGLKENLVSLHASRHLINISSKDVRLLNQITADEYKLLQPYLPSSNGAGDRNRHLFLFAAGLREIATEDI